MKFYSSLCLGKYTFITNWKATCKFRILRLLGAWHQNAEVWEDQPTLVYLLPSPAQPQTTAGFTTTHGNTQLHNKLYPQPLTNSCFLAPHQTQGCTPQGTVHCRRLNPGKKLAQSLERAQNHLGGGSYGVVYREHGLEECGLWTAQSHGPHPTAAGEGTAPGRSEQRPLLA